MQNQHHPDQPPPNFARFLETGEPIDVSYFHTYKQEPIRMLCKLLTFGGDFLVMAKNPTQYKAIARLMQAAFPGVPMRSSFRAVSGANTLILDTKKGTFEVFYIGGPLSENSTETTPEADKEKLAAYAAQIESLIANAPEVNTSEAVISLGNALKQMRDAVKFLKPSE